MTKEQLIHLVNSAWLVTSTADANNQTTEDLLEVIKQASDALEEAHEFLTA